MNDLPESTLGRNRRLWKVADAGVAGVLVAAIVIAGLFVSGGSGKEADASDDIQSADWSRHAPEGQLQELQLPNPEVGSAEKQVSREQVMDDEQTLSDVQKQFGEWVVRQGTLEPRVIVDGKSVPLNKNPSDPIQQEDETGYECDGTQFITKTRSTLVVAREVTETLLAAQDVNVYPGFTFNGRRYLATGEIVRAADVPRGTFAPQKLAVYGPPLHVKGTVRTGLPLPGGNAADREQADPSELAVRKVKLSTAGEQASLPKFNPAYPELMVNNPASRNDYEQARNELLPLIGNASYFSLEMDTARCKEELAFKAGLSVNGGWGSLTSEFRSEEREEYGVVFARGVEVAYTMAVDNRPEAARWVNKTADVSGLINSEDPLMYVSEVVYGRAWLVVAISTLSTTEQKALLNGTIDALWATFKPEVVDERKRQLSNTTVKVLNLGGDPDKDAFSLDLTDYRNIPAQIRNLQKPALTPKTARPIAYRTKWLANDAPAGWVGVVPMRTYTQQTPSAIKYRLTLRHYNVRKEFGGAKFIIDFGGGGCLNIGTCVVKPDGTLDKYDPDRRFLRQLNQKNHLNLNHELVAWRPVPSPEFMVLVRQAELKEGIRTWQGFAERVGDGFGETSLRVNVQELLSTKSKYKDHVLKFPGDGPERPNEVTVRVSIQPPPPVGELRPVTPLPDVSGGGEKGR